MNINHISTGENPPSDINVIIEVPMHVPVKYEIDKKSGAVFVDRFFSTTMTYPCHYGFIPGTLSDDDDPCDVLVLAPHALVPGAVIRSRPVGVLLMSDEAGKDEKIIAVPHSKMTPLYDDINEYDDLPQILRNQITHFFEHYKDLEKNKWVKIDGWDHCKKAQKLIIEAINRAK
ncbi:MAG: inorganic diphosphatase [Pseudomonadota bacterium]